MKRILNRTINLFLTAAIAVSSLTGVITAEAEAGDVLYSFDASQIDSIGNDTAANYGIKDIDTGSVIWSVVKQDSTDVRTVYYDAIRFSTQTNIGDKRLMTLNFADDTINNPDGAVFEDGYYVFTSEISPLYKDSGYMAMNVSGNSGDIFSLRMKPSSGEYKYTGEAYLADADGNKIGNSVKYKSGNDTAVGSVGANGSAASILYLKAEINLIDKTYSAWLVQRGTDAKDYTAAEETDADLLVENQPFNDDTVTALSKISIDVTKSSATNGMWLHNIYIEEGKAPVDPDTESPLDRAKKYMENSYVLTYESYGNITTDLNKPLISVWTDEKTGDDVEITWESSDTSLIADDGTYTAPAEPSETKTVTMTATLSYNGETVQIPYELTIRKYSSEKLIDSEDFLGKSVVNGAVDGWELYDASEKVDAFTNLSLSIADNKLTIKKTSTANESDNSERYKAMYRFKEILEQNSYSKTYRKNLRGEYKVVTEFMPGIGTSSQFQIANIATGAADAVPARAFAMCIKGSGTPGVYEYVSSTENPPIYNSSVNKTNVTATYYINTEEGTMTVQINNGDEYGHSVTAGEGLQGMMYIIKSKASVNDTITVNSIDLYKISGYDDGTDALYEKTKSITASELTSSPAAVTGDLNELPEEMDGAKIEWTSSDEELMSSRGILSERPIDSDKKITMTAKITEGKAVIYKEFYFTVLKEDNIEKILQKAAEAVTYETLTSESADNITKNLKTLPSSGLYGTSIEWKSSDTTVMSDAGKLLRLGTTKKLPVTMTAVFSKDGVTYEKRFDLQVGFDFLSGLTTLYETDFSGSDIAENIVASNGAGTITQENGQILLSRNTSGGSETSIKVYPAIGSETINVTGEMIVETDINMRKGCQKAEIALYDTNGNRITSFYTTGKGNGPESYTNTYRNTIDGDVQFPVISVSGVEGLHFKLKVYANLDTQMITIYTDVNDSGYKAVYTDKYVRETSANLSYVQINAVDDTNGGKTYKNTGVLEVNKVNVSVNEGAIPEIITDNIDYFGDISSKKGVTAGDIILPVTKYDGTTVTWTSSDTSVMSNDGKLMTGTFSENKDIIISFKLSLDSNPEICYEKSFNMTVLYIDPKNIAVGKTAVSSVISNTGHGPEKAVDGISTTTWETMRSDETPALTVNLGSKQIISSIKLSEAEILGKYPVKGYVIETSNDNKKWTVVYTGTTLGSEEKTISVTPSSATYVRYRVTSKDSGNSGLKEFAIYMGDDDKSVANADLILLIEKLGSLTGLTSSVTLPSSGEYGSKFEYSSSIPAYFSNTGSVIRPASTASGTLTITSSYGAESVQDNVKVSVLGTSVGGGSNGGGGSSGGSSSSRGNGSVAAMPQVNNGGSAAQDIAVKTGFNDVTSAYWGFDYIEALRVSDIVSGDENGNFRPNDNISREEFLKMLISALKIDVSDAGDNSFKDISESDWSRQYVSKAVSLGIVNGISEDTFGKGMPITRQDMAVMCIRALNAVNRGVADTAGISFADTDEIAGYAAESVKQMSAMGVINGYDDNSFRPYNNATRGEAAKIICKLI